MESGGRLPECVLELGDVKVAMATRGRREGRKEEMVELKTVLGCKPSSKKEDIMCLCSIIHEPECIRRKIQLRRTFLC